jgi:hypothetical protein
MPLIPKALVPALNAAKPKPLVLIKSLRVVMKFIDDDLNDIYD